ncbi:MAG: methyltransferase domain-containing protein [Solirubrobacterales bacterium]|nr:methyltransferase domain-containing protein [Solirubrobacterales bacterium]
MGAHASGGVAAEKDEDEQRVPCKSICGRTPIRAAGSRASLAPRTIHGPRPYTSLNSTCGRDQQRRRRRIMLATSVTGTDHRSHDSADRAAAAAPPPLYTIGSSDSERDRLRSQTDELHEHSVALLQRVGIQQGWKVLEIACGPRGVLELLTEHVGPTGAVTGLDINPVHVAQARRHATALGLGNVTVLEADARRSTLPAGSFDLVYARLILVNVPDPERVVSEMVRLVKPGGWLACEEADCGAMLCQPPHPAYSRLTDTLLALYRHDGADILIGRRLHQLLDVAGVIDIGVEARADVPPPGHPRRTVILDILQAMRTKITEQGLLNTTELDALDRDARTHLADSGTMIMPHLSFMAWGRKPF